MKKTEYYYNGKLIRTSKTHNYTHAVLRFSKDGEKFRVVACASSKELAERRMMTEMSNTKHNMKAMEERIRLMKMGRKVPKWYDDDLNTLDGCIKYVEDCKVAIENYYANARVVELEKKGEEQTSSPVSDDSRKCEVERIAIGYIAQTFSVAEDMQ